MESLPPVTVEAREIAEFDARVQAERMSDDPKEDARRALLQDQHEREIRVLMEERTALKHENEMLARKVRTTRTALTRKLETVEWWTKVVGAVVVVMMFGATEQGKAVILFIIQVLSKGAVK